MEFGADLQNIGLKFGVPKTLGSIFGGQQGNSGMDMAWHGIESWGVPPGSISKSPNENALSLSMHRESLENLINVY